MLAALGAVLALLVFGPASPASAHDSLVGTDPAAGAAVEQLPEELTLTFSGVLITGEGATEVVVTDAAGTDLTGGDPIVDGVRVRQPLAGSASGAVEVAWRVVSSDGHPISGTFTFTVGDGAETPQSTPLSETPDTPDDQAGAELTPLWIGLGAVVVIVAVIGLVMRRRRPSHED